MIAKFIYESLDFERGKNIEKGMSTISPKWKLFQECHSYAGISENFRWVSEIKQSEKNPKEYYFTIESEFFYTDINNYPIPVQWVITLDTHWDDIFMVDVIADKGVTANSIKDFCKYTEAFDDEAIEELFEAVNFERTGNVIDSMGIGLYDRRKSEKFLNELSELVKIPLTDEEMTQIIDILDENELTITSVDPNYFGNNKERGFMWIEWNHGHNRGEEFSFCPNPNTQKPKRRFIGGGKKIPLDEVEPNKHKINDGFFQRVLEEMIYDSTVDTHDWSYEDFKFIKRKLSFLGRK